MQTTMRGRISLGALLALLWWPGGLVYMVYSSVTASGPGGWLVDLQMRWFDAASGKVTVFLLFLAWLALGSMGQVAWDAMQARFWPVNRDAAREQRRAIAAAGPHWRLGAYSTLALASLALAASVMGLYLALVQLDQADQRETVHRIDLSHEPPPVLESVRFAHLGALQVHEARYEYKRRRPDEFHRITPLVPSGWRPEQAVRLIYDEQNRGSSTERRLIDEPVALTRNDLPAFVESALRRQGLQLASPYYVARPVEIRHGRVVSWMADSHWMPMAAAIAGAALFVVGAGVLWLRRRLRRSIKAAPARPGPQPSQPETV